MEVREKKVLIYAISAVLIIAVLLNFYHGSTVTKIDIPGLFGIEFNSGSRIEFIEYGLWGVTASGSGILSENKLNIDYQTSFGTIGKAVLELSDNGQSMTGRADDLTTGASTILILYRE